MILDSKEVEALLEGRLIIDFAEISLSRSSAHHPCTYQGSGSIYQNTNGELELKLYHVFRSKSELAYEDRLFSDRSSTPGKLFQDDEFFSLNGKDMRGRDWAAEHILIDPTFNYPATGKVILTTLNSIKNVTLLTKNGNNKPFISAFFGGDYELPYNEYEETKNSKSLSICRLDIQGTAYTIKKLGGNLQINCSSESDVDVTKTFDIFLEALQMGIGQEMCSCYLVSCDGDVYTTTVKAKLSEKNKLPKPIPIRTPWESKYLQTFITKYLEKFKSPYNQFYGYWHRIGGAYSGTLENQPLVLTTAIEGILKTFYEQHAQPDDEFLMQINQAIPIIEDLQIGGRAKSRILTTLNNAKDATAKNTLRNLKENNIISNKMLATWEKARNKSVHPADHDLNDNEIQKLLDNTYTCLRIFYALLMNTISYHGVYYDYSQDGWPRSDQ